MTSDRVGFYSTVPVFSDFSEAVRGGSYRPLPDDWVLGFSDVVGSTKAVADGRYKAVNMVGAGVIAAVSNAIGRRSFPFVFGGDGTSFAVQGSDAEAAKQALQAMAAYSRDEFKLDLRVAMAKVADIRAGGQDVRVARFGASPDCAYAMFSGGGLSWFESQAKRGAFLLDAAPTGVAPDLSGLTCRWGVSLAKNGVILSLIVAPRKDDPRYAALVEDIVRDVATAKDVDRPITIDSVKPGKPQEAIDFESLARRASGSSRLGARLSAVMKYVIAYVFFKFRVRTPSFDMPKYMKSLVANADFRKFDDGLKMTVDCSPEFADALETRLAAASEYANYGTFRQENAILTCFVPSSPDVGHIHFVDGAGGGYTMAAKAMKARLAAG